MVIIIIFFNSVRLAAHGKIVKADSLSESGGFWFFVFFLNWTPKYLKADIFRLLVRQCFRFLCPPPVKPLLTHVFENVKLRPLDSFLLFDLETRVQLAHLKPSTRRPAQTMWGEDPFDGF